MPRRPEVMTIECWTCHRCNGRGALTGLAGKPMRRVWWYCHKCAGTGVLVFHERLIVATGVRRAEAPEGYAQVDAR